MLGSCSSLGGFCRPHIAIIRLSRKDPWSFLNFETMKGGKLVKKAALQSLQSFSAPSAFSMANGRKILIFNISCFSCVSMPLFLFPKLFKVQHSNLFYFIVYNVVTSSGPCIRAGSGWWCAQRHQAGYQMPHRRNVATQTFFLHHKFTTFQTR